MKKEYKTPVLSIVNVEIENVMQNDSNIHDYDSADSKKNGTEFVDDGNAAPDAPKKFWDDEE